MTTYLCLIYIIIVQDSMVGNKKILKFQHLEQEFHDAPCLVFGIINQIIFKFNSFQVHLLILLASMNGEDGIEVYRSELHGDGVRALHSIPKDSIVYIERPRFFLQNLANRSTTLVCGHCARFLGSVGLQLKYLQKLFDRTSLAQTPSECMGDSYDELSSIVCPCSLNCGEYYCSNECRDLHWDSKGHKYMCTGTLYLDNATESALYKFKSFCVQTNEIFLMIGNMMAEICCFLDQAKEEDALDLTKAALSNYESYVHNLWWDVATLSMKKGSKEKVRLEKSLKGLVKEAAVLLRETLRLKERGLHNILNEELIAR